ncbi:hypothetical protein PUN28_018887 [Cardiocondyla obscurior]|uniref:Uncharacterized protein n=1 Tax=Cardiocondyla obscurior TaxID=286306 RepID=A0AAW2ECG0_9HYME
MYDIFVHDLQRNFPKDEKRISLKKRDVGSVITEIKNKSRSKREGEVKRFKGLQYIECRVDKKRQKSRKRGPDEWRSSRLRNRDIAKEPS